MSFLSHVLLYAIIMSFMSLGGIAGIAMQGDSLQFSIAVQFLLSIGSDWTGVEKICDGKTLLTTSDILLHYGLWRHAFWTCDISLYDNQRLMFASPTDPWIPSYVLRGQSVSSSLLQSTNSPYRWNELMTWISVTKPTVVWWNGVTMCLCFCYWLISLATNDEIQCVLPFTMVLRCFNYCAGVCCN